MRYWTVPPMFAGRTVAVLASGESMSQEVADSVKHLPRIAINTTYKLAPDADIIFAADSMWWVKHPEALECPGLKVALEMLPGVLPNVPPQVHVLRNSGRDGFDRRPDCLRTLNNSGGMGLQIAAHGGAARVLLCGFDMRGGHWHGDHPDGLTNITYGQHARWIARITEIAPVLNSLGIDVVNVTPGSALDCFRRQSLDDALAERDLEAA